MITNNIILIDFFTIPPINRNERRSKCQEGISEKEIQSRVTSRKRKLGNGKLFYYFSIQPFNLDSKNLKTGGKKRINLTPEIKEYVFCL